MNLPSKFAIVTATIESAGDGTSYANVDRCTKLFAYLTDACIAFERVSGYYNGVFQGESFLIPFVEEAPALDLARMWGQESIITEKGLVFVDGRKTGRRSGIITGEAARATGNYTVMPDGSCWSFILDFVPGTKEAA